MRARQRARGAKAKSFLAMVAALSLAPVANAQNSAPAAAHTGSGAAEPAADPEYVRDLLTRGTEALSASRNEEARSLLSQAYRLRRSYDVAAALGQAELELGRHRDASEHLEFAIREFPPGESRKLLKQLQDAFATAKSRVATLRILVNQPGCEVTVDGALIGTSPLPADVFVEPGQHTLGARLGTGDAVERALATSAGKDYTVELSLNPKPGAASATDANLGSPQSVSVAPRHDSSEVSPKTIVLVGGSAITAVLLGLGIAERLRASDADDEAATLRSRMAGNCPGQGGGALCRELVSDLDRRNSANRLAVYSFVGAGVTGAATAAVWFLWDESRDRETASRTNVPRIGVSLLPHDASISFTSSF